MFENFNMKKFVAYTALTMVAAFILSAVIFFSTGGISTIAEGVNDSKQNINIEKVFSASAINTISIDTSSADIHFIPEERSEIKVQLTGYITSGEPDFNAEQNGDTLNVYARGSKGGTPIRIFDFNITNLKLDIYVPLNYSKNIDIKTQSGNVNLGKLNIEKFTCKTSSGDVKAEDFAPKSSSIETSSGNVVMNGFGGDMELQTSSGDANIKYAYKSSNTSITTSSGNVELVNFSGDLKSRAQSGDRTIDYAEFNGNIDMHSSSGNIELNLPAGSQFGIKVNTSSGNIRTDFSVAQSGKINDDNLEGNVGNSNNQIIIGTSSGDVKIRKK